MIFAKGAFIEVDEKRCLNVLHHGVECNHCIGHCPADAIHYDNNHIYLNKDSCNGCGLCLSDCPTEVFHSKQWDETTIAQDIETEGWKITQFFCERHTLPYKSDKSKERGAAQLPTCLSSVSKGAWYEIGLKTEVEIHLDQCQDCPMAETVARLVYNVNTAAEWLKASGHTPRISVIHQSTQGKIKKSLLAIETGLKVTSRRDLFVSLFNRGQQLAGKSVNPKDITAEMDKKTRNMLLPNWQKRLEDIFKKNRAANPNPTYWPTLKINDQCVNCGMCRNYCPSGTLQMEVKDGVCEHSFTSGNCLDCRICELFCPKEAISRDREKVERPFDPQVINTIPVTGCKQCESTTVKNDEQLCYWCQGEVQNDNELKHTLKGLWR
ncbi:4Fe-4S binding protein [Desulfitobacterium hafniense]|uniref:4Fe-4S ferredoxin-type domain-containing protein n=1 Tax=Desulfitobacterium hafniense (strain Y51) TaxID=138119 RepID=Q24Z63_DESHY|nr:4Fe-4S binding protein [Desulfitobacterium hafniense]BAE82679.1 hypothetical protein DSY0890 [Desulfitobacterium hafniense Y51]